MPNRQSIQASGERKARRRTTAERDQLAVKAVELRIARGLQAYEVQQILNEHLDEDRKIKQSSEISRLIRHAQKRGLFSIKFHIDENAPSRNPTLEKRLESAFDLHKALVVNVDEAAPGEDRLTWDDHLHMALGAVAGDYIRDAITVLPPSTIGCGGGRAVCYVARRIAEAPPVLGLTASESLRIISLTGRLHAMHWGNSQGYETLDADDAVATLAGALGVKLGNIYGLPLPLACNSAKEREDYLAHDGRAKHISAEFWDKDPTLVPDIAIIGIGAFCDRHRAVHPNEPSLGGLLKPIEGELRELLAISEKALKDKSNSNVGSLITDICNHFGYVQKDILDNNLKKYINDDLKELITRINRKILSINPAQLGKIKRVVAIAGGPSKHYSIATYMRRTDTDVHILCTDSGAAEHLLELQNKSGEPKRNTPATDDD